MYTYPLPFNLCPCGEGKFLLHFVFNTHLIGQRRMKLGTEKYLAQHKPRIIQVFSGVAFLHILDTYPCQINTRLANIFPRPVANPFLYSVPLGRKQTSL